MNSFKMWCLQKYKVNEDNKITHLFMDNGKINVPLEEYPSFLERYYKCMKNENICLVEKLGNDVFMRYFLDIDFKNKSVVQEDILSVILEASNLMLDDIPIICECSEKKGYHIIYNKVCDKQEAESLTKRLKESLEEDIQIYIDSSVYATGLRMVGSKKFTKEKGLEDRYYRILGDDNQFEMFKYSIIRLNPKQTSKTNCGQKCIMKESELNTTMRRVFDIDDINITNIKKFTNGYITMISSSKFCLNINNYHKNANVYFVYNPKTNECYQKCFCRCLNKNVFQNCGSFKSKAFKMPYMFKNSII